MQGESPEIDKRYRETWLKQVQEKGTTATELQAAFERMQADNMSTLTSQLHWMQDAGYQDVNCWHKNYSFAVFSGRKISK